MNDIKGYEGLYAITENGEVWSYHNERFLRQERKGDYFRVELWKNESREKKYVHDLVAQAFLPNLGKKLFVIHKDGNFLNAIETLEYYERDLQKENINIKRLAFNLFYNRHYKDCKIVIFERKLDLTEAVRMKKDYIEKIKPIFN